MDRRVGPLGIKRKNEKMHQLTFAASVAGLLMLSAFLAAASYFDGSPFRSPFDSRYTPAAERFAMREPK